ncbi:hypothetical protein [Brevundimonas naejangsanensis]|nr:hypothetical protein [Brevundimonas naejangsanensis]
MSKIVIMGAAVLAFSGPAAAQTQQWSSPVTTERWSEAPTPPPPAPPANPTRPAPARPAPDRPNPTPPAPSTGAPYTPQVDADWMAHPRPVTSRAPLPAAMVGRWELWVPGGVWYSQDGAQVLRHHTAGAALNSLTIRPGGAYVWAGRQGRLTEIQPWFAQPGERYFEVRMDSQNRYMARYDAANDRINLFFWGVGGHAARGDRR